MNKIMTRINWYISWRLPRVWKPALFAIVLTIGWTYYLTNGLYS